MQNCKMQKQSAKKLSNIPDNSLYDPRSANCSRYEELKLKTGIDPLAQLR